MFANEDSMIPDLRLPATNRAHRQRELGFDCRAKEAPLPMYKSFFDPNLSTLWKNPAKRHHLKKLGFIDSNENMVDIHEQRRKFHIVEHDIAQAERIERMKKMEKDRQRQDRQVIRTRAAATTARLQQVAEARGFSQYKRDYRQKCGTQLSTGSLPAVGSGGFPGMPSRSPMTKSMGNLAEFGE
mmetsp:Transcript_147548/g.257403  ORF Transcript_147548/g.257403 Transcript_147548/m.257403 type:complete len:184 (-) Transcript_147548:96-647(-)